MLQARRRLVNIVDQVLDSMQDVPSSLAWAKDFSGGMIPVEPAENIRLQVKSGELPLDLAGAYMRIGPNAAHWPARKRMHVFDGDGMVHCIRMVDGKAVYHCKYMETPRYQFEQEWGQEWFLRIGEMYGKAGIAKILTVGSQKPKLAGLEDWETSTANTAISFTPDGKLWACMESGPPFRFHLDEAGIPKSVGFDTLTDTHRKPISAHPKFDQRTGETFFHGKELMKGFYCGRAIDGKITDCVDLNMPNGFHHDMCITENYVVIIDGSMRFNMKGIPKGEAFWKFKKSENLRFGVFPRASGAMTADAFIWIEAPVAAEIVHTLYAYDEGGKIILWTPMSYYEKGGRSDHVQILGDTGPQKMHRLVIDVEKKSVDIQSVPGGDKYATEFPRIRDDRVGLRVRHGYSGVQSPGPDFNFTGILKWDFDECRLAGEILFPEKVIGGEPVFMPKGKDSVSASAKDDEGYICMFLWNCQTEQSSFALFDAESFSPTPVAELLIPRRVPLGFHAACITEAQFQQQLKTA